MPLSSNRNLRERFDALLTEYILLTPADKSQNAEADKAIQDLIKKHVLTGTVPTLTDEAVPDLKEIRKFARLLVELYPKDQLSSRSSVVSADIQSILRGVLDVSWQHPTQSFNSLIAFPDRPLLRELQRKRGSLTAEHDDGVRVRGALFSTVSTSAFIAVFLLLLVTTFAFKTCNQPLVILSLAAAIGSVGAWISVTFRLRDADFWALAGQAELTNVPRMSLRLSPAIGGLGAVLAVLAVATRVLGGDLVPKFDWIFVSPQCEILAAGKPPITSSRAVWMNILDGGVIAGVAASTDSVSVSDSSGGAAHPNKTSVPVDTNKNAIIEAASTPTRSPEASPGLKVLILLFFVALAGGWSERLVPDTLDWISGRLKPR